MRFYTPVWRDPVGWSEKLAKTPLRVFVWIIIHLVFVTSGLILIHYGSKVLGDAGVNRVYAIIEGGTPIIFFGVIFPSMYLYSMYRLLAIVREKENIPQNHGLVPDAANDAAPHTP